jgi:hypothetical protein
MFRLQTCLFLIVACHGSNPPADPAPDGPALPPIDPDTEPSHLPPEPNSPSDPQTLAPNTGAVASNDATTATTPAHTGGMGGMGGFGGMLAGTGGSAPVTRR